MTKASTRGVENPVPTDMALIGDTCMPLHKQSLPRRVGPNFGQIGEGKDDQFRVEGNGESY